MKLRTLLTLFSVLMALSLTACPKKQAEGEQVSSEPVEGSSTGNNEKSTEGPAEEMQEKKERDSGDAPAEGAEAPAEEKKE